MPADLRRHVRYPEDLFRTQAQMYATYHMTNPVVFYNKEDQWQWPVLESGQNSQPMQPYYTMMTLPGDTKTEFIQMLPFTPRAKDNLAAWMAARSDAEHYGQLVVFQFPKQKIVYGPRQIQGRINQDQVISPQITLWNQQGSQVIWGTLLVIPIGESLIYVRPLYLRSPQSSIPELKRVIVAYQNQIVMAETLTKCLAQIFGREVEKALAPDQLASTATSVIPTAGLPIDPEEVAAPGASDDLAALAAEAEDALRQRGEGAAGRRLGPVRRGDAQGPGRPRPYAASEMTDTGGAVKERVQIQKKEPTLYKVVLLNDDYTTMEFVVEVLMSVFQKTASEAYQIMMHVHVNGRGIAGVYPWEVAETKAETVISSARESGFPLQAVTEEA